MLAAAGTLALYRAIRRAQLDAIASTTILDYENAWAPLYALVDALSDDRGGPMSTNHPRVSDGSSGPSRVLSPRSTKTA